MYAILVGTLFKSALHTAASIMDIAKVTLVCYSILVISFQTADAARSKCYQCSHVAHPRDCNKIIECNDGEVCHVVSYAQPDGHFYYTTGCLAKPACPRGHAAVGKRDIAFCNRCCDGDYCNKELCDGPNHGIAGPRCLKCDTVMHPSHCNLVVQCRPGQKCFTRQTYPFGELRYEMGCAADAASCSPLRYRSVLGKRSMCTECCTGENCNRELCLNTGSPQTNAPGTVATRIPVTNQPAPAATTQLNECVYKGHSYHQDESFQDGCDWKCTCIDATIGRLSCRDVCPTYTHIPDTCTMVKKPGECCAKPECPSGSIVHYTNITSPNECFFEGKRYKQGDGWRDGCNYECTCTDASRGFYNCTSLCYTWTLPGACHLNPPATGKCCQTPWCPTGYKINYPDGYVEN